MISCVEGRIHMTEERIEELAEKAAELHRSGYNCAQAVACALSEEAGVDEELCFRLMEGFGLGMGQMHETCGAISGAVAVLGFQNSRGRENPTTKASTYGIVRQVGEQFLKKNGSTSCMELKGLTGKGVLRTCPGCVEDAVRIACSLLEK